MTDFAKLENKTRAALAAARAKLNQTSGHDERAKVEEIIRKLEQVLIQLELQKQKK